MALAIPAFCLPVEAGQDVTGLVPSVATAAAETTTTRPIALAGLVGAVAATASFPTAPMGGPATVVAASAVAVTVLSKATTARLATGPLTAIGRPTKVADAPILATVVAIETGQVLPGLVPSVTTATGTAAEARTSAVVGRPPTVAATAARPTAPVHGPSAVVQSATPRLARLLVPKATAAGLAASPLTTVAPNGQLVVVPVPTIAVPVVPW